MIFELVQFWAFLIPLPLGLALNMLYETVADFLQHHGDFNESGKCVANATGRGLKQKIYLADDSLC